ncbi:Clp protease ClpP [Cetobacterium sp. 2A]|uniref:head maturation protease, ClpP-related n=1 Tax=Cetobacterium sp. 2A TaxID=2754723 RepID=UPI00163BF72F|nr:head maturation protease, ClpP-related [Cetobacterium sp. 2A]MBC2855370.1 Clp protease ClpP [Cetobacterium sp. 2A]
MSWWRAVKKKGNKAEILILGEIGNSWWSKVDTNKIREELSEYDDVEEITLRIDSPGGSVFAGIGLYSYLKDHKAKVKVYIDGMCASIATVIAMAGDEIYMNNASQFMIHNPWTVAMGEANELRHDAEVLDGIRDSILNAYMTKCKITKEELIVAMDKATYYKADRALAAGFITEITHATTFKNYMEDWDLTYSKYENKFKNPIVIENKTEMSEEKNMTLKELQDNHPELYNQILESGRNCERERIKALDGFKDKINKAGQELLNKAKYETFDTAEKLAFSLIQNGGIISTETPKAEDEKLDPFATRVNDAKDLNGIEGTEVVKTSAQSQETVLNYIDEIGGMK